MEKTNRKITIDPVTRVEGHGRVTIQLGDQGQVENARFHIVEFRGFERFIQGHPYWEAPLLVQRLCGICPVSHHLAAAKAIDQIYGVDPDDLHPGLPRPVFHPLRTAGRRPARPGRGDHRGEPGDDPGRREARGT